MKEIKCKSLEDWIVQTKIYCIENKCNVACCDLPKEMKLGFLADTDDLITLPIVKIKRDISEAFSKIRNFIVTFEGKQILAKFCCYNNEDNLDEWKNHKIDLDKLFEKLEKLALFQ